MFTSHRSYALIMSLIAGGVRKEIRLDHQVKGALQAAVDACTQRTRSVKAKGTGCSKSSTQAPAARARTYEITVRTRLLERKRHCF